MEKKGQVLKSKNINQAPQHTNPRSIVIKASHINNLTNSYNIKVPLYRATPMLIA